MNLSNRQQLLGVIAIAVVVLWAGQRLVLGPLIGSWQARAARLEKLRRDVAGGTTVLRRENSIRQQWDTMRTNTLTNDVSVAESQVLQAFDRWSRASGVSIVSLRPQWKKGDDDSYMTLECGADASGDLSALTRLLYEVDKDPLALKVDKVDITARDAEGQQLTLGLQVSGLRLNRSQP
jgi:hypothetical protein